MTGGPSRPRYAQPTHVKDIKVGKTNAARQIFFTGFCASVARLATLEIEHGVTNLESVSMDTLKALINVRSTPLDLDMNAAS